METTIQPYDIIPLVNAAWQDSFFKTKTNKNAISERGWYLYNRALLLNAQIRSTMTNEEKYLEAEGREDIVVPSISLQNIVDVILEKPHYDPEFLLKKETKDIKPLSMSQGTAAFCLQVLWRMKIYTKLVRKLKEIEKKVPHFVRRLQWRGK